MPRQRLRPIDRSSTPPQLATTGNTVWSAPQHDLHATHTPSGKPPHLTHTPPLRRSRTPAKCLWRKRFPPPARRLHPRRPVLGVFRTPTPAAQKHRGNPPAQTPRTPKHPAHHHSTAREAAHERPRPQAPLASPTASSTPADPPPDSLDDSPPASSGGAWPLLGDTVFCFAASSRRLIASIFERSGAMIIDI